MAYDWWSTGWVQNVTLWAGAFVVVAQQARYLIRHTTLWQNFAGWVQTQTPAPARILDCFGSVFSRESEYELGSQLNIRFSCTAPLISSLVGVP
jgi:hypothetical protein